MWIQKHVQVHSTWCSRTRADGRWHVAEGFKPLNTYTQEKSSMSLAPEGTARMAGKMQRTHLQNLSVRYQQRQSAHHHLKGRPVIHREIWRFLSNGRIGRKSTSWKLMVVGEKRNYNSLQQWSPEPISQRMVLVFKCFLFYLHKLCSLSS